VAIPRLKWRVVLHRILKRRPLNRQATCFDLGVATDVLFHGWQPLAVAHPCDTIAVCNDHVLIAEYIFFFAVLSEKSKHHRNSSGTIWPECNPAKDQAVRRYTEHKRRELTKIRLYATLICAMSKWTSLAISNIFQAISTIEGPRTVLPPYLLPHAVDPGISLKIKA
jgi:hypothetical protein